HEHNYYNLVTTDINLNSNDNEFTLCAIFFKSIMKRKILKGRFIKTKTFSLGESHTYVPALSIAGAEYRRLLESIKYVFCVFIELKEALLRQ
ncbi:MAG: hypothetical protein ACXW02_05860, partial [Halobacteriota archaeon]